MINANKKIPTFATMKVTPYIIRRIGIFVSFIIVCLILWNTSVFFQKFKNEERIKMKILAESYQRISTADLNSEMSLETSIIESNHNIPMLITTDKDSIIDWANLDSIKASRKPYLKEQLAIMKQQNAPIAVAYQNNSKQLIYYRDSDILTRLKYYPIALILILLLFTTVIYLFLKSSKIAEQNQLWTGMAKETAHQIGTPLSSLLGWVEILRMENTDENIVSEVEKDVLRLKNIAERFSKIGSIPTLSEENIVAIVQHTFTYIKSRSSKQLTLSFETEKEELYIDTNVQLLGWVIENLLKNAIDATAGKGVISVKIKEVDQWIKINISDNGKGMTKHTKDRIFSPGFTTKKRGWGLGLSLAKRIIEDYHKGRIFVEKSEMGIGTVFGILLRKKY